MLRIMGELTRPQVRRSELLSVRAAMGARLPQKMPSTSDLWVSFGSAGLNLEC